jgi:hypothetical protein
MTANTLYMQELAGGKENAINVENKATKQSTAAQTHHQAKKELVTEEAVTEVNVLKANATTVRGQVTVLVIASRRRETKVVSKLMLRKEKPLTRKKLQM